MERDDINAFALDPCKRVLDLELLRELILGYVIHDDLDKIYSVRCCRLVNKAWLSSTSRILFKCQEPLFRFRIREKKFMDFMDIVTEKRFLDNRVPPHAIKISSDFFLKANYPSFLESLEKCASGLVELDITISGDQDPLLLTPNISLSKLCTLNFHLDKYTPIRMYRPSPVPNENDKVNFIQSIFDTSSQLKVFKFKSSLIGNQAPSTLGSLKLPFSIEKVDLECELSNNLHLDVLYKDSLPNLKQLTMYVSTSPVKDGLFTSILQNVRKNLQVLRVVGMRAVKHQPAMRLSTFQLPLMENLKTLKIETPCLALDEYFCSSSLQQSVPVLNHITLTNQTVSTFRKWVDSSCYSFVTSLTVSLVSDQAYYTSTFSPSTWTPVDIDQGNMQALCTAFPNLLKLDIALCGTHCPSFAVLMKEMRKLQHLHVCVHENARDVEADVWDALLIGIPEERVAVLKGSPALFDKLQDERNASIRNLTDLQTLTLRNFNESCWDQRLISDASFLYAFFKMPKLNKLILTGGFNASKKMLTRWVNAGRKIEADAPPGEYLNSMLTTIHSEGQ